MANFPPARTGAMSLCYFASWQLSQIWVWDLISIVIPTSKTGKEKDKGKGFGCY